jgi:hypothetical protein
MLFKKQQLWFYTFTFYHSESALECWSAMSERWHLLHCILTKQYGGFSYVKVLESHSESNYPHLHILATKCFPAQALGRHLSQAGFGYQAAIQRVSSQGAGSYVKKYLTKAWSNKQSAAIRQVLRLRLITFSADIRCVGTESSGFTFVGIAMDKARACSIIQLAFYAAQFHGALLKSKDFESELPSIEFSIPLPFTPRDFPFEHFYPGRELTLKCESDLLIRQLGLKIPAYRWNDANPPDESFRD